MKNTGRREYYVVYTTFYSWNVERQAKALKIPTRKIMYVFEHITLHPYLYMHSYGECLGYQLKTAHLHRVWLVGMWYRQVDALPKPVAPLKCTTGSQGDFLASLHFLS